MQSVQLVPAVTERVQVDAPPLYRAAVRGETQARLGSDVLKTSEPVLSQHRHARWSEERVNKGPGAG